MEYLRIGGAALNQTPLDFEGNGQRIRAAIQAAKDGGVQLLCLPELAVSGYGCEDAFFSAEVCHQSESQLAAVLPETRGITVIVGLPCLHESSLYNCAAVLQNGKILAVNPKRVLAREGVHYEQRWFRPWAFGRLSERMLCGQKVPFGDIVYQLGPIGLAIEICEEAWGSVPAAAAAADMVQIVVNPSASHFSLGKYSKREQLVANSSRAMNATYLYTNLLGCEAGRLIYDGGILIADRGVVVARGPRFGLQDGYVSYHDIHPESATVEKIKSRSVYLEASFHNLQPGYGHGQKDMFNIVHGSDPRAAKADAAPRESPSQTLIQCRRGQEDLGHEGIPATLAEWEFLQAEVLGLFDYLRKSRHRGYVVSLSGGVDSTTCAVLVAHMVAGVLKELGPIELARRLGWTPSLEGADPDEIKDPRFWLNKILFCIYQKTAQSGLVTENASRQVASTLGCQFEVFDVEPVIQSFIAGAEVALQHKLTWQEHDLALQNIQARARSPLPWLIANVRQSLLLTTSNRSEAAVGYATMDGDTAGGLAPLAGIDKPFLRRWLKWASLPTTPALALPFGPLPVLDLVNVQSPTAELRPKTSTSDGEQTDEADLMPYKVLERIERYFVRDRLGPGDIAQLLAMDFPETSPTEIQSWVAKFVGLWKRNQWKRERIAPAFHLDEISLDPKSYCRYPILSG